MQNYENICKKIAEEDKSANFLEFLANKNIVYIPRNINYPAKEEVYYLIKG